MALRYLECNAEMLECLGSKKGEGGGADPSAVRPAYSSVDRMPEKTPNNVIIRFFNMRFNTRKGRYMLSVNISILPPYLPTPRRGGLRTGQVLSKLGKAAVQQSRTRLQDGCLLRSFDAL